MHDAPLADRAGASISEVLASLRELPPLIERVKCILSGGGEIAVKGKVLGWVPVDLTLKLKG